MSSTGKVGGSSPLTPGKGSEEPGSAGGAAPKKPFEEVRRDQRDGGSGKDSRRDDEPKKDVAPKKEPKKTDAPPKERPKTVAEWRAMRKKKAEDSSETADALAKQNPALAKPMDVRSPVKAPDGTARVEGLISKQKMDQIVEAVRIGVNRAGAQEMQFDLKSQVLGGLSLKISTVDGRVYATFLADQPGVKDLVDLNAAALEKALRDRGLGIGEIKTEMRHGLLPGDQQGHGQPDTGGGEPGSGAEPGGFAGPAGAPAERKTPPPRKTDQSSTDYTV